MKKKTLAGAQNQYYIILNNFEIMSRINEIITK